MLDTYGRKYIKKFTIKLANFLKEKNFKPNHLTFLSLIIGIISAFMFYLKFDYLSIIFLWLSGLCDVLDGTLARITKKSSNLGMVLDIFFDRLVEGFILVSIALRLPNYQINIIILFFAILMSMTIFLISGSIIKKESEKSFYYQAGLMERTEGFILISLIIIFKNPILINVFSFLIIITIYQRFKEIVKYIN